PGAPRRPRVPGPQHCAGSENDRGFSPNSSYELIIAMMPENYLPRRIVSLQPSITVTLRDLGLLDRLVACTKYCLDACPELSREKCLVVEDSWTAKAEHIVAARPDLVIASVPYQVEALAEIMKSAVLFLGLAPKSLS